MEALAADAMLLSEEAGVTLTSSLMLSKAQFDDIKVMRDKAVADGVPLVSKVGECVHMLHKSTHRSHMSPGLPIADEMNFAVYAPNDEDKHKPCIYGLVRRDGRGHLQCATASGKACPAFRSSAQGVGFFVLLVCYRCLLSTAYFFISAASACRPVQGFGEGVP